VRIIDAARHEFSRRGFDGASVATIASRAGLAPSAAYHYFGGKVALYEEVFETTATAVWDMFDQSIAEHDTLLDAVEAMITFATEMTAEESAYTAFLALVPMETSLHPEFVHMRERRTKRQDMTFARLAEQGLASGELDGFDVETATEMLRSLLMGWFVESYFRPDPLGRNADSVLIVLRQLAKR